MSLLNNYENICSYVQRIQQFFSSPVYNLIVKNFNPVFTIMFLLVSLFIVNISVNRNYL